MIPSPSVKECYLGQWVYLLACHEIRVHCATVLGKDRGPFLRWCVLSHYYQVNYERAVGIVLISFVTFCLCFISTGWLILCGDLTEMSP